MTERDIEFSLMAGAAYESTRGRINQIPYPEGWDALNPEAGLDHRQDDITGFEAVAFTRTNGSKQEIVISFAGTYPSQAGDISADIDLAAGAMSPQLLQAASYYQDIKQAYSNATISFTGHSLGGGLAALIGVFFNKEAITFDQAPFRKAASFENQLTLIAHLAANGYGADSDLITFFSATLPLTGPIPDYPLFIRGTQKITVIATDGEILTVAPGSGLLRIDNDLELVPHGPTSLSATDLHSTELLTALKQSHNFSQATWQLPFMLADIFDATLFSHSVDPNSEDRNLLTHLIRHEFGIPGQPGSDTDLLTRFGNDMVKIGVYGAADVALQQGLERVALRYYYDSTDGAGNEFFEQVDGGLRFDLSRAGSETLTASSQAAAYNMLANWLLANVPNSALAATSEFIDAGARRFTLPLSGLIDTVPADDDIADFMLSGSTGGNLTGGGGKDLLVGRGGMDVLVGGAGDDQLFGGTGYDTYVVGQGIDEIVDADGRGVIKNEYGNVLSGAFIKQADGSYSMLGNAAIKATKGNGLTITLSNGAKAWISDFDSVTNGKLGISLHEDAPAPQTTRNIVGDLAVSTTLKDDLGNYVATGGTAPGRADTLLDSSGNDLIQGLGGNDTLNATRGGDDRLEGGDGKDWVYGGAGNDLVIGGAGRDVVLGGAGADELYADGEITLPNAIAAQNAPASGLQGEALSGADGDDLAIGGTGNDVLFGGTGQDILIGGAGNDDIEGDAHSTNIAPTWSVTRTVTTDAGGGTIYRTTYNQFTMSYPSIGGNDDIYAGAGDDWVRAGPGNDYVDGGAGQDVIFGQASNDDLFGGGDRDVLVGDGPDVPLAAQGDDYLDGEAGDDLLDGGGGADLLFGGTGLDQLQGGAGNDFLDGEADDDVLLGDGGADQLFGGDGADYLQGDAGDGVDDGNDVLEGGAGNDTLLGQGGSDEIHGGEGNDRIAGDNGGGDTTGEADSIFGGAGDDVIDAQGGDDMVDAGADNDVVLGGAGNDQLAGGSGNDELQGGQGNDSLDGGEGSDVLFGEAGDDVLAGGAGNDTLLGGMGNDTLNGGEGDDVYYISPFEGNDHIVDSGGTDWLVLQNALLGDLVLGVGSLKLTVKSTGQKIHLDDFDPENPYSAGGIEYFQFADGSVLSKAQLIDTLGFAPTGTPEADVLSGTALSETIESLAGDDVVTALAGNDIIRAGDGADVVHAGEGNDQVFGGVGNDVLLGDGGNDTLYGDAGDDLLAGGAGTDILQGCEGNDAYRFQIGDAQDTVIDALGANTIALGVGLTLDAILFSRQGSDLLVSIKGSTDRLTVKDWFAADSHFDSLTLGNGTVLDHAGVEAAMPRNQAPITSPDAATVTEDGPLIASGNVLINDSDPEGRALRIDNPGGYVGTVGSLSIEGNGAYAYVLDNDLATVQRLAAGQSLTERFAYLVTDDDPNSAATAESAIVITVQGRNDLPMLGSDSASTAEDAAPISGNVLANDSDIDANTQLVVSNPGSRAGAFGTLTLASDGIWSYSLSNATAAVQTLAAGQTVLEQFAFNVSDGVAQVGGSLSIGITGENDAPTLVTPLSDQSASANNSWTWQVPTGSFADVDAGEVLHYQAALADGSALPSWLAFDAATQTFSGRVPKSTTASLDIRVAVTDGHGVMADDVFLLSFAAGTGGSGGGNGGGSKGNEGVGNGVEGPPPGHDTSFNDGPGTGPGNPGAKGGIDSQGHHPSVRDQIVMTGVEISGGKLPFTALSWSAAGAANPAWTDTPGSNDIDTGNAGVDPSFGAYPIGLVGVSSLQMLQGFVDAW